jgi:hypothetical protein
VDTEALVWDSGNEPHLTAARSDRLLVSRAEVDGLYENGRFVPAEYEHLNPDGTWEWQVRLIGRTPAGRLLTVACAIVERGSREAYRPITAWDATAVEKALYDEEFPDG